MIFINKIIVSSLILTSINISGMNLNYDPQEKLFELCEDKLEFCIEHSVSAPDLAYKLILQGARVNIKNKDGDTPLHVAAKHGRLSVVCKVLLEEHAYAGATNLSGNTPLHEAVTYYDGIRGQVIGTLLRNYPQLINIPNEMSDTALHIAIKFHSKFSELIKFLIFSGADINQKNVNNKSPLDIAQENGDSELVNFIIDCSKEYLETKK